MRDSHWLSAFVLLVLTGLQRHSAAARMPCAELHTPTPLVAHGSKFLASCVIAENCPWTEVQWHYNGTLLQPSRMVTLSNRTTQISVDNFSEPSGYLTCSICREADCQIVAGQHILSGNPPRPPQNLSCQTNLAKDIDLTKDIMQCTWIPDSDTGISTEYTFHTEKKSTGQRYNYTIPAGESRITIKRTEIPFFSKIQVYVKAQNALGLNTSKHLLFDPLEAAKFDPLVIESIRPPRDGCLSHSWRLQKGQDWLTSSALKVELRLKPVNATATAYERVWNKTVRGGKDIEVCGLLHGTEYQAKARVRYKTSPWSDWSGWAQGSTLMKAPAGSPDTWLRVMNEGPIYKIVQLAWKPSKQFRANGRPLTFEVSLKPGMKWRRCVTDRRHCTATVPKRCGKVYLTAQNPAGRSRPTEVRVYTNRDLPRVASLSVRPHGDTSLEVHWSHPSPANSLSSPEPIGYVVECRQLNNNGSSFLTFHLANRNQTSALLSDEFEPYTPYEISVYPKYAEGVGLPLNETVYTRQGAPSAAPIPNLIWRPHAELTWDEIPMTKRNGIIQSYQVFYRDEQGNIKVITAPADHRRVVLEDLEPMTMFKAFIMVSTCNGSYNGTMVAFHNSASAFGMVLIGVPTCVGIILVIIIIMLTSLAKHKWLKTCLWPKIPDPANSSIRKWSTAELIQESPPPKSPMEPVLVFLSHFSVVDLTDRHLEKLMQSQSSKERWLCNESDSDLYSCSSSQSPYDTDGTTSESVPYATLVFSGGYQGQPPPPNPNPDASPNPNPNPNPDPKPNPKPKPKALPPTYLRSESTQPLLAEEELQSPGPFSPLPYRNVGLPAQAGGPSHDFGECEETRGDKEEEHQRWEDFPLLNSLAIKEV
ncbi:granulocyte colony-stimulating factor receptor [Engraulis encrasicolus]|uniref:granulocyte colony-stimulating factor receptor n=1 Tax=Engraulis encrasicolus TaxID=184585 RepID=UPI002FCF44A0